MAVSISKAEDKMQQKGVIYRAIKTNTTYAVLIINIMLMLLFMCVMLWYIWTTNNLEKIHEKSELRLRQEITELKNETRLTGVKYTRLTMEYNQLKGKLE